jgi:homoserine dehydrogenase
VEIARNLGCDHYCQAPPLGYPEDKIKAAGVVEMDDIVTNYYLRVQAQDKPGVLSKVAGIMADHRISIHSVVQKGRDLDGVVPVVFITHSAREKDMMDAAKEISDLDAVAGPINAIRIEDENLT